MNVVAIYTAIKVQTDLVYKGLLGNDSSLVDSAMRQIKKLTQELMIKESVAPNGSDKKINIYKNCSVKIHSYATESQTNIQHDIDALPQSMEGKLAEGATEGAQEVKRKFEKF